LLRKNKVGFFIASNDIFFMDKTKDVFLYFLFGGVGDGIQGFLYDKQELAAAPALG
jgi:hypothetical protein